MSNQPSETDELELETDTYTIDHATFMLLIQVCGDAADLLSCNCSYDSDTPHDQRCDGSCTHSMALQALRRLQEAHERNDPHCTCNACLAAHAARQTAAEAGVGEILVCPCGNADAPIVLAGSADPSCPACGAEWPREADVDEDDDDMSDEDYQRLMDRDYPVPAGLKRRHGVEAGCGKADCRDCYEPAIPASEDDGQREVMIEQLEQWANDLQTNAPGAVRGVIAGMREVAADLKRGAK